ncbi:MAG: hypothetical protein IID44_22325 [Planctomycetes bacterium]|nr:hypothetical protein [Planctomycetota bacterium]
MSSRFVNTWISLRRSAMIGDFTRNQGDVLIARITVVPEPTCVVLAIIGVVGLCVPMRRRKRRSAG